MSDFDLVDALRKLRYGDEYADKTFSSPEDKALAVASGAGANLPEIVGNAGADIVNTYAPRDPADRVRGRSMGQSLGEQTREAARKNPGAAATGNLAVTAPLRTAATLAAGPASVPAEALLQGALGGLEGAYASQEGERAKGAGRGAAIGAALPLAAGAARGLSGALSEMSPPKATGGSPTGSRGTPASRPSAPAPKAEAPARASKTMLPPSSPEAEAIGRTPVPKGGRLPAESKFKPAERPSEFEGSVSEPSKTPWTADQEQAAREADAANVRQQLGIADDQVFPYEAAGRAKFEGRHPRSPQSMDDLRRMLAEMGEPELGVSKPPSAPPPPRGGEDDFGGL